MPSGSDNIDDEESNTETMEDATNRDGSCISLNRNRALCVPKRCKVVHTYVGVRRCQLLLRTIA